MNKLNKLNIIRTSRVKWGLAAALSVMLLAGCGGGGGGQSAEMRGIDQNTNDLIAFMKGLIAMDENSEVVDINPLSLATDNSGDPATL